MALYLYADSPGTGQTTVEEYADIQVVGLSPSAAIAVRTIPKQADPALILSTNGQSYSPYWTTVHPAQHVVVDGLTNGWLAASALRPTYSPSVEVEIAEDTSAVAAVLLMLIVVSMQARRRRRTAAAPPRTLE
jgi:hypothetical protein